MTGTSMIMTFMVMVTTYGPMGAYTMASGSEILCMEQEAVSLGVMAGPMREHTLMIKSKVKVFSSGLMGGCMMVNGKQGKCMGPARTLPVRVMRNASVSGKPGREHVGNR